MPFLNLWMSIVVLACKTGFLAAGLEARRLVLTSLVSGLVFFLGTFLKLAPPAGDRVLFAGLAGGALLLIYLGWLEAAKRSWIIQALLFAPYLACLIFAGLGAALLEGAGEFGPLQTTLFFMLLVAVAGLGAKKLPGLGNAFNQGLINLGVIIIFLLLFFPGAATALVLQTRPLGVEMQINFIPLQIAPEIAVKPLETVPPGKLAILIAAFGGLLFSGYLSCGVKEWWRAR
ncbi:MAG: hypothetical protein K6T66_09445 [Peptococcaceae bacterium]|nr:hypothetical protein [Peptococcaceae bacterium]